MSRFLSCLEMKDWSEARNNKWEMLATARATRLRNHKSLADSASVGNTGIAAWAPKIVHVERRAAVLFAAGPACRDQLALHCVLVRKIQKTIGAMVEIFAGAAVVIVSHQRPSMALVASDMIAAAFCFALCFHCIRGCCCFLAISALSIRKIRVPGLRTSLPRSWPFWDQMKQPGPQSCVWMPFERSERIVLNTARELQC